MQTLSEQQIIHLIQAGLPVEASLPDGSLTLKILDYVPYIGTAIHHGHRFREELLPACVLDESERYYEEDPGTGDWLDGLPITLIGGDSRYEYDLNRSPEECIYTEAWDKPVWNRPLTEQEKNTSRGKHARYYRILGALLEKLENKFGRSILFDIHSYNMKREGRETAPVFNVGTSQIEKRRWHKTLKRLGERLNEVELPNLDVQAKQDAVFYGKGYQATFTRENFSAVLTVPLEVKKVYMDEHSGEFFPMVHEALRESLSRALFDTAASFASRVKKKKLKREDLSPSQLEPVVYEVDRRLFNLVKQMDTLLYVNPVNLQQEKRRFFARGYHYSPEFRYRQLRLDPYSLREKLYRLPIAAISDPSLRELYREVVDAHAMKVELLATIGTDHFLYNSLRYYGKPDQSDLDNAHFLLHAPVPEQESSEPLSINAHQAAEVFREAAKEFSLNCKVQVSKRLLAKAMVDNQKKTLLVNEHMNITRTESQALAHHEIGVHLLTTLNAIDQPLKVFRLGLPNNTHTQEGLAILCEHLSGNLTISRLHSLARRVVAVKSMLKGKSFGQTCRMLEDDYGLPRDEAFTVTVRVYRAGGFTKDYVYLSGLRDLLKVYKTQDISGLYIGKGTMSCLPIITDLMERGVIDKPSRTPPALTLETEPQPVLEYLPALESTTHL